MYKVIVSGAVKTRQGEHEFDDFMSARKSLEMGQDVHQPTFEDGVRTGVTIIPFHAVDSAGFGYSPVDAPDPVDANCVEHESGGCETLYDGNVTFTYDEEEGTMAGTFNMTGAFTEGATVNVTIAGGEIASGTIEDHDGMLGALLSTDGDVVGAIFTADGVTTIDVQGESGEPVTMPVKVEQCEPEECPVLFEGEVTFVDYEADFTLSEPLVEGSAITATLNGEEMNGIVQVDGYNAGCRLEKDGEDVGAINSTGLDATIESTSLEEGSATLKIEQCLPCISIDEHSVQISLYSDPPTATVTVTSASPVTSFSSADESIATVANGTGNEYIITGIGNGETVITFVAGDCEDNVIVKVTTK